MIRVLEKNVADKIAAGEVIERPLSIVKELVENSIDSGATAITVEIKHGGKDYIRVTDNGCGIAREEVECAFLRHATSKIVSADDLNRISTLGFRGEALASIAAVTRTELITKTKDADCGTKVIIHGGEVISKSAVGCPDGTTIIVNDLFYNTPARAKFLKADTTEGSKIIDFIGEIALGYCNIRIRLINNGNIVFSTQGRNDQLNTIISVYNKREYKDLVSVDYSDETVKINGYISKPSLSRTNKKDQIHYVNGRIVKSKIIEKGIVLGYKERLFDGRFPVAFLFIDIDPGKLDVNIHPNKREVRFDDDNIIIMAVAEGIKQALSTKESLIKGTKMISENKPPVVKEERSTQVDIKSLLSARRESEKETPKVSQPSLAAAPVFRPFDFDDLKLTGAIFGTYITAVDDNTFYLIDQHAAHERIFYEKLLNSYYNDERQIQVILTPIMIDISPSLTEKEGNWMPILNNMGFNIEQFGNNTYIIKEIPVFMEISEAENFVNDFLDNFNDGINLSNTVVINKIITKSCKSAVKAHDYLSMEEMDALLNQLKQCENPFSCPHGRPTFIKFTSYEIEKMFKRV